MEALLERREPAFEHIDIEAATQQVWAEIDIDPGRCLEVVGDGAGRYEWILWELNDVGDPVLVTGSNTGFVELARAFEAGMCFAIRNRRIA